MTTAAEKSPEALQIACELPAPQAIRDLVVVDKSDQIETTQGKGICQAELESSSITMSLTGWRLFCANGLVDFFFFSVVGSAMNL